MAFMTPTLEAISKLGMKDTYIILGTHFLPTGAIEEYWYALEDADLLKYRFSNWDNRVRTAEDVCEYHELSNSFFILDCCSLKIVSEISFTDFSGRTAQLHFSMAPDTPSSLTSFLSQAVVDHILNHWVDGDCSYLDCLIGVTPVKNRAACIFVLRAGFEKLAIVPNGVNYFDELCDAMLTIKKSEEYAHA